MTKHFSDDFEYPQNWWDDEEATIKQNSNPKGSKEVLPEVLKDLQKRSKIGKKKYGEVLKTDNGRDSLIDAYQEALDLVMYLKQAIMERNNADNS